MVRRFPMTVAINFNDAKKYLDAAAAKKLEKGAATIGVPTNIDVEAAKVPLAAVKGFTKKSAVKAAKALALPKGATLGDFAGISVAPAGRPGGRPGLAHSSVANSLMAFGFNASLATKMQYAQNALSMMRYDAGVVPMAAPV